MKIITPPTPLKHVKNKKIFLAGSIEMDTAEEWQDKAAALIKKFEGIHDCLVYNPRRDDFDTSQEQTKDNPYFAGQVNWELDALTMSDHILMYFDKETKSPITLLELGSFGKTHDVRVVCPEGFWRKGNVDIFCDRYNIKQYKSLEEAVKSIFV